MDGGVIADVIAEVRHGRGIDRCNPYGIDPQPLEVVQCGQNTTQITNAIAVAVGERARINLVDDATLPPQRGVHHTSVLRYIARCVVVPPREPASRQLKIRALSAPAGATGLRYTPGHSLARRTSGAHWTRRAASRRS